MKTLSRNCLSLLLVLMAPLPLRSQPSNGDWNKVPLTALKVGVAEADITPAVGIPLAGYVGRTGGSTGIHDPLKVVAVVFDDGRSKAAILSFDSIQLLQADGDDLLRAITKVTNIPATHIVFNASHTHAAPWLSTDASYRQTVISRVVQAVQVAVDRRKPVSLGYGEGAIDFNINRRAINAEGKSVIGLNPSGPNDKRVKILRIDADDSIEPLALVKNAACHANVFRDANKQISADFPGLAKSFVERAFNGRTTAMYLQGCAGDLRANLPPLSTGWRNGSEADMTWAAWSLGAEAVQVSVALRVSEQLQRRSRDLKIFAAADTLHLAADPEKLKNPSALKRDRIEKGKIIFPIRTLAIGEFLFISLPGEPVIEYGLGIEQDLASLGKKVFVLGYGAGDVGYIPVKRMMPEGGYETEGPYWAESEAAIRAGVKNLVSKMFSQK